ncbi:MAG: hypothetical protein D3910_05465 [Candidatus Electrothrix sp. ATG2]|nr:hypothetical protein [Candidatus Electrothrix sp. ATG2]
MKNRIYWENISSNKYPLRYHKEKAGRAVMRGTGRGRRFAPPKKISSVLLLHVDRKKESHTVFS